MLRVNCVVAAAVLELMMDIGRERHLSEGIQDFLENTVKAEPDQSVALVHNICYLADQWTIIRCPVRTSEQDSRAHFTLLPGLYKTLPGVGGLSDKKKDLDFAESALSHAVETGRDDLRVVDDKSIARLKVIDHILERIVGDLAGHRVKMHKS